MSEVMIDTNEIERLCDKLVHRFSEAERLSGGAKVMAEEAVSQAEQELETFLKRASVGTLIEFLVSPTARATLYIECVRRSFRRGVLAASEIVSSEGRANISDALRVEVERAGTAVFDDKLLLMLAGFFMNLAKVAEWPFVCSFCSISSPLGQEIVTLRIPIEEQNAYCERAVRLVTRPWEAGMEE